MKIGLIQERVEVAGKTKDVKLVLRPSGRVMPAPGVRNRFILRLFAFSFAAGAR